MDKCRQEFENWEMSNGGAGYDYEVWQAAWNARQVEVLGLSEVPEMVSKEAIATALCGASGSVGGDWRDKKMVRVEGSRDRIVDAIYSLQLPAPAAQPRDPKMLVEALERIVSYENKLISHSGARHAAVRFAREALAEWKGGLNE
jgi:hypothetical protein